VVIPLLLYNEYIDLRFTLPLTQKHDIDTELVSNVISRLDRGKAADIAGLTAEHVYLIVILHCLLCYVNYLN